MTTRREFISKAALTSFAVSVPLSRAGATSAPNPPNNLTIDAPSLGSGFYADPYSTFATWYVNGATGINTPNPGRDRRPAGYVYKNYENALLDVFHAGNPGLRRIVIQAGTYAPLSSSIGGYFPAGGPDAAHPCVVQGDPGLSAPPVIDGGLSPHPPFCFGNAGGFGTSAIDVQNIVIRKLEVRNFTGDSFYFWAGASSNVTIEYCNIHGNRYPPSNPSSTGGIAITSRNCATNLTVRYCKFSDFKTLDGGYHLNCVPFETYGSDNVTIQNCFFAGAYAAIRAKLFDVAGGTANNWIVMNNVFANCYMGIDQGTNSETFLANNNWVVTGNLFYGPLLNVGNGSTAAMAWGNQGFVRAGSPPGSGLIWANNTIADDMTSGFGWIGATDIVMRDNVCLAGRHMYTPGVAQGAQNGDVFSVLDYNAYGGGRTWNLGWNQAAYAFDYQYSSFAQWQRAYSSPQKNGGAAALVAPAEFLLLPGRNPDAHSVWISNIAATFPNAANRDYSIAANSPLLSASSTRGRVGYDPANSGPGW